MVQLSPRCAHFLFSLIIGLWATVLPWAAHTEPNKDAAVPVIVAPVQKVSFADRIEALGTTKANESLIVTPDTSEKISAIYFEEGSQVQQGTPLVSFDQAAEQAELNAAKAEYREAKAAHNRTERLRRTNTVPASAVEESLAALERSRFEIAAVEARLRELTIKAPFAGVLGLREFSVGALVQPGDRITTLDDLSQIKVDFEVPAIYLASLKPGLAIQGRIDAYPQRTFNGSINIVNTQVDPVSRTLRVRALFANPQHLLKSGLLMRISLQKNPRQALVIPEEALIKRGAKNFVYLLRQNADKTQAQQVEIQLGSRRPGQIEVLAGLKEGDKVIAHGSIRLSDGAEVAVRAIETQDRPLPQLLEQSLGQPHDSSTQAGGES